MNGIERERLANTRGLIGEAEGERLAEFAALVHPDRAIVEIGSHTGLSTMWIAAAAAAHVFAVDPWADPRPPGPDHTDDPFELGTGDAVLAEFDHNLDRFGFRDRITPLRAPSAVVAALWVQPIGLLFIDAIHTYEGVRDDLRAWIPHVAPSGILAVHDYGDSYPGVRQAVDEIGSARGRSAGWIVHTQVESLWAAFRA